MTSDNLKAINELLATVKTLRAPGGCPWDRAQTHETLVPYAIEESFELAQAIESGIDADIKDELGDVLFQVILHSAMAEERNSFKLSDVIQNINAKLIRRHPHVFAGEKVKDMDEIFKRWDEIKAEEKKNLPLKLLDVSPMPALQRATKIGNKTNKLQFDWSNASEVQDKVLEEMAELNHAVSSENKKSMEEEMGDLLFSIAQWARHLGLDAETCLRKGNEKFLRRFNQMGELARQDHRQFTDLSLSEKESYWNKVKKTEK